MTPIEREVERLLRLPVPRLRERYAEAFGEATRTGNKAWLVKRIAWRLQAAAQGDLSERARRRAAELANDADLRLSMPRAVGTSAPIDEPPSGTNADRRLPPAGTVLTRPYKGGTVQVRVLSKGFEHDGATFPSLSAVAKAVTGSHVNGFAFFRLGRKGSG
jgi:hypothetical protein